jgi:hypothetical protein
MPAEEQQTTSRVEDRRLEQLHVHEGALIPHCGQFFLEDRATLSSGDNTSQLHEKSCTLSLI